MTFTFAGHGRPQHIRYLRISVGSVWLDGDIADADINIDTPLIFTTVGILQIDSVPHPSIVNFAELLKAQTVWSLRHKLFEVN